MKKLIISLFILNVFVLFPVPGQPLLSADHPPVIDQDICIRNELIVKFKPGTHRKTAQEVKEGIGAFSIKKLNIINAEHILLPDGISVDDAIVMFRNDPNVEWAEPNYIRRTMAISSPNDPFFIELWSLHNTGQTVNNTPGTVNADIHALEAWETTTDCSNVIIAIIDSGVDLSHPDIIHNLWTNPGEIAGNGKDDDKNGYIDDIHGWNFVDDNNDVSDSNNHGTHVAGVIAAEGNNAFGTTGVCWSAKLMILKFLDTRGTGNTTDEISAIQYAVANNAKIINASFGESGYLQGEYDAISASGSAGQLFVASSGNQGFDNDAKAQDDKIYPGGYDIDNIISVAASDQDDQLPDWSVYGATTVDLAAPGDNIYSAYPNREVVWTSTFNTGNDGWSLTGTWARVPTSPAYLTDSPSADYSQNTEAFAVSPMIDLSEKGSAILTFTIRGSSDSDSGLFLETRTSLTGPWTNQKIEVVSISDNYTYYENGLSGTYLYWADAAVMLTALNDTTQAYIRFRFTTGGGDVGEGWDIDDIMIHAVDTNYPAPVADHFQFLSGTSAAAPLVTGAAGILWSHTPGLSHSQIKRSLINGVDVLPAFEAKVVSGGRLNVYNSLQLSLSETVDPGVVASSGGSSGTCFIDSIYR
ncbi:MAG: S8 family serine peptidase [Pseudomonadota bacterium]